MVSLAVDVLDRWKGYLEQQRADRGFVERQFNRDKARQVTRVQILDLLEQFQKGKKTIEEFRTIFDKKTRKEWDQFGLAGMNGAMFLNMLVKHIPDEADLPGTLKTFLQVPGSPQEAEKTMRRFLAYLNQLIEAGKVSRREVQPARLTYFLSAWWHMQRTEDWPIYYGTATRVMEREQVFHAGNDFIQNYFTFRETFLQFAQALNLSIWDFEHLCVWLDLPKDSTGETPDKAQATPSATPAVKPEPEASETDGGDVTGAVQSVHAHVQWVLAKLAQKFGLKVWIAQNDRSKLWKGETLGSLSISNMPALGMDEQSQKTIQLIDVVWLRGNNQIAAAFEVEYTTSIYSGLLRLSDLATLAPNLTFPLYIVAPEDRIGMVRRELSRPTFQAIELHQRCGFFSIEELLKEVENIMKWAKDPSAINTLAQKVESIN